MALDLAKLYLPLETVRRCNYKSTSCFSSGLYGSKFINYNTQPQLLSDFLIQF